MIKKSIPKESKEFKFWMELFDFAKLVPENADDWEQVCKIGDELWDKYPEFSKVIAATVDCIDANYRSMKGKENE